MDSNDWKLYKSAGKIAAKHRAVKAGEWLREYLIDKPDIEFTNIQDWYFRLTDGKVILDIFPQKQRYHNVTLNKRGGYRSLHSLMDNSFKHN